MIFAQCDADSGGVAVVTDQRFRPAALFFEIAEEAVAGIGVAPVADVIVARYRRQIEFGFDRPPAFDEGGVVTFEHAREEQSDFPVSSRHQHPDIIADQPGGVVLDIIERPAQHRQQIARNERHSGLIEMFCGFHRKRTGVENQSGEMIAQQRPQIWRMGFASGLQQRFESVLLDGLADLRQKRRGRGAHLGNQPDQAGTSVLAVDADFDPPPGMENLAFPQRPQGIGDGLSGNPELPGQLPHRRQGAVVTAPMDAGFDFCRDGRIFGFHDDRVSRLIRVRVLCLIKV
ncbi:hypothetical protein SDC9_109128 [bioreactor metagenome]|uniref:Uncharacterized protein n=1 Tax=bioreactor metagenome TaxID=1076179 RepID=A0A645BAB7_9ZZZZ